MLAGSRGNTLRNKRVSEGTVVGNGLVDPEFIRRQMTREAAWCGSHGAEAGNLGMGMVYYALAYVRRAEVAVCLGSGGGFVPRLMRQAQRDLGIAAQARTILVDANRPEAGWGAPEWLAANSFLRTEFADIEFVVATTAAAAETLFARQGLRIDYLHIDADHSFSACLDDLATYHRFLRPGSIVTLHDTNFPGAGVCDVVQHLRTRSDFDVVDFPDIGAGTAILRVNRSVTEPVHTAGQRSIDSPGAISVRRKPNAPALAPPERDWKYLASPAFAMRSVLAAHFLRECPTVVEIGGGRVPINDFLTGHHEFVLVVDPFLREARWDTLNARLCAVWHVRARFQDLIWRIDRPRDYGLVMLGLELQGLSDDDRAALYLLVNRARRTVVEFPTSWDPSRAQFEELLRACRLRVLQSCKLDLSGNDVGDMTGSWPPRFDRELHVLEPMADLCQARE